MAVQRLDPFFFPFSIKDFFNEVAYSPMHSDIGNPFYGGRSRANAKSVVIGGALAIEDSALATKIRKKYLSEIEEKKKRTQDP